MSNSRDEDVILANAIEDRVRKNIQDEPALTATGDRISEWCDHDLLDRMIDVEGECLSGYFASLFVPLTRFGKLLFRFGMESKSIHPRRKSFALTSSHGIVDTSPDSISRHRRSASAAQRSSTSVSGGGSKLSMSNPASVARSPSGKLKISLNASLRSRGTIEFYRAPRRVASPPRQFGEDTLLCPISSDHASMHPLALLLAAALTIPSPLLVLRSGERINVETGVRVEERTVVFRSAGVLYSMPLSEVDLETTRSMVGMVVAKPADRGKLKVSPAERDRLLRELEQNHSGKPAPPGGLDVPQPSKEQSAALDDEWSWRRAARSHEEAVRQAREEVELLQTRADQLRRQIENFVSLGYRPRQFTYQTSQLQLTLDAIPAAQLEVTRAQRALDQFKEDARKAGVLPGWLR